MCGPPDPQGCGGPSGYAWGMTAHTVEYIRYRIPEEQSAQFLAAHTRAAERLAAAPQCVDYELARVFHDFAHFILRVTWTSTEDHVEGFRASGLAEEFLAEIGPYAAHIEETRHYKPTAVRGTGASVPTLYAWAGGAEAYARLTEVFYEKVRTDEVLAPVFTGLTPEHAEEVAHGLAEIMTHAGGTATAKNLTEPQRRRWVGLLQDAADEAGLPTDAEFRSAFLAHAERETRLAVY